MLVIVIAVLMKTAAQAVLKPVAWDEWLRPGNALGWLQARLHSCCCSGCHGG